MQQKLKKSLDAKQIFLLLFARELIRNSQEEVSRLNEILEEESKPKTAVKSSPEVETEKPNLVPQKKEEEPLIKSILSESPKQESETHELSVIKPAVQIKTQRREISGNIQVSPVLRIPEPKLPPEFQYLRPTPSRKEIDLDKLNPFINDPAVKEIECEGPNKPIVVSGMMGRKPTELIFNNNEVEDIINRFSAASKIPVDIGLYKVVVGNLIFSAIVSEVVPSRFLITKMASTNQTIINPKPMPPGPNQVIDYSSYIKK